MFNIIDNTEYNQLVPPSLEEKLIYGRLHSIIIYLQLLQNKIVSGYTNEYIFGVVQ